jgi:hypothetical protein
VGLVSRDLEEGALALALVFGRRVVFATSALSARANISSMIWEDLPEPAEAEDVDLVLALSGAAGAVLGLSSSKSSGGTTVLA